MGRDPVKSLKTSYVLLFILMMQQGKTYICMRAHLPCLVKKKTKKWPLVASDDPRGQYEYAYCTFNIILRFSCKRRPYNFPNLISVTEIYSFGNFRTRPKPTFFIPDTSLVNTQYYVQYSTHGR